MPTHQLPLYPNDLALAARIVAGDEDALDWFSQECLRRSGVLARCSHVPRQDCEDIAQDALLTALDQMRRELYRGEGKLTSWLEQIIRGKIALYWRRQPHGAGGLDRWDESKRGSVSDVALIDMSHTQEKRREEFAISKMEIGVAVWEALLQMSLLRRAILVLTRIEGYTPKELSEMCNMPVRRVRDILYAAQDEFQRIYLNRSSDITKRRKAILAPGAADEGVENAQSGDQRSRTGLRSAGTQSKDHGILLWACRRIGQALARRGKALIGRPFAQVRALLAGSSTIRVSSAGVG